jgi:hypothetical protein
MRLKKSGYPDIKNGVVERVVIGNLGSGVYCEHHGHIDGITRYFSYLVFDK